VTLSKAEQAARKARREAYEGAKAERVRPCVQEGWPLREIYQTHHTSSRFMKRWFPDYTGITAQESGSLSMAIQGRKKRRK
jgi:hypothetical protein